MLSIKGNHQRVAEARPQAAAARTSAGLRDLLFDEIEALRNGSGDIQRASAIAKLASQIIGSARLDVDYALAIRNGDSLPKVEPLALGVEKK